ncbi:hypothetical protein D3C77_460570 [compost metagenome]
MQREVHLPQRRLIDNFRSGLSNERPVRCNIYFKALFMTYIQQSINFRMKQRFAFYMKINIVGMRLNLIQYFHKIIHFDELCFPLGWRAKAAGQITNACRFDIKLFKFFHLRIILPHMI